MKKTDWKKMREELRKDMTPEQLKKMDDYSKECEKNSIVLSLSERQMAPLMPLKRKNFF